MACFHNLALNELPNASAKQSQGREQGGGKQNWHTGAATDAHTSTRRGPCPCSYCCSALLCRFWLLTAFRVGRVSTSFCRPDTRNSCLFCPFEKPPAHYTPRSTSPTSFKFSPRFSRHHPVLSRCSSLSPDSCLWVRNHGPQGIQQLQRRRLQCARGHERQIRQLYGAMPLSGYAARGDQDPHLRVHPL